MKKAIVIILIITGSLFSLTLDFEKEYDVQLLGEVKQYSCGVLASSWIAEFSFLAFDTTASAVITCPGFYENDFFQKGRFYTAKFREYEEGDDIWDIWNKTDAFELTQSLFIVSVEVLSNSNK